MPPSTVYRIAVIEDNAAMRNLLQKILAAEGYECLAAGDAATGRKLCLQEKPDLILMDVHLPDDNGIEVCRKFKADPALHHIPILILTGEAYTVENRVDGLEAGADDYVIKPFNNKELVSRIKGILKASTKPTHS